jgi:hypothetical protein
MRPSIRDRSVLASIESRTRCPTRIVRGDPGSIVLGRRADFSAAGFCSVRVVRETNKPEARRTVGRFCGNVASGLA